MPRMPDINNNDLYSTSVPGSDINPRLYGENYGELSRLGGTINQIGNEIAKKMKQAEDSDYVFSKELEDRAKIDAFILNDKEKNPGGGDTPYYAGHAERVKEYTDSLMSQGLKDAPSGDAARMYQQRSADFLQRQSMQAQDFENEAKANYFIQNTTDKTNLTAGSYNVLAPDPIRVADDINIVGQKWDESAGVLTSPDRAMAQKKAGQETLAETYMQALRKKKKYSLALDILEERTPSEENKTIANSIDPEKRARLIQSFKEEQESVSDTKAKEYDLAASNMTKMIDNGADINDPTVRKNFNSIYTNVAQSSMKPEKKAETLLELDGAKAIAELSGSMYIKTPEQMQASISRTEAELTNLVQSRLATADMDPSSKAVFGQGMVGRFKNKLEDATSRMIKSREADAPAFFLANDEELRGAMGRSLNGNPEAFREYKTKLEALKKQTGVRSEELLSKEAAKSFASVVNGAKTSQSKAEIITRLQNMMGDDFRQGFNEMVKDGGMEKDYFSIATRDNQFTRERMIDNIDKSKDIKLTAEEKKSLNEAVETKMADYSSALNSGRYGADAADTIANMKKHVFMEALVGSKVRGDSVEDAVEKSYNTIVNASDMIIDERGTKLVAPRGMVKEDKLRGFVRAYTDSKKFQEIRVPVAKGFADDLKEMNPEISDEEIRSKWYSALEKNGRWVSNPAGDGIELVYLDSNGPVKVPGANSKTVSYKYSSINANTEKDVISESKGGYIPKYIRDFFD